eukprot:TRINITY_DN24910_c0_g1_i1.p1 TRINITY_DN24910_c0_g1~~TRINITY_DN24910_c0_g1_i1.p1  ORF type:complete len:1701 (+),score=163.42 TRINITY_DN24910_c0_g1_i1:695-5104(+)
MIELDVDRRPITHEAVRRFISDTFDLRPWVTRNSRVAVALPNGRDCALVTLACMATHSCVPMNPDSSQKELSDSFSWLGCVALVALKGSEADSAAKSVGMIQIHVVHDSDGQLKLSSPCTSRSPLDYAREPPHRSLRHSTVLTIMTSGTTGQRKAAKHSLESVVVGGFCIARSWKLSRQDVGLNMMPMFHIGGISRNLFAATLSGGSVCFAPGFDAERFWTYVDSYQVTWYYGSPTIHEEILRAGGNVEGRSSTLRFVANAAGHLQHSLAVRMANEFQCAILPCYGCSEAMPISSPPVDYKLSKPGSSGILCGPDLLIVDSDGGVLDAGETGHIIVRGCPCMQGYDGIVDTGSILHGWFDTGDMGHLDVDGWLFITGRSKEVINRGGEIIAPMEVEEALSDFSGIKEVAAFAAPHDLMQEVVGVAVVALGKRPSLRCLQRHLAKKLHPSSMPQIVVYFDALPRGKTGKVIRLKLAERCGLPVLKESTATFDCHWESIGTVHSPQAQALDSVPCQPVQVDFQKLIDACMASGLCADGKASCVKARGQIVLAVHIKFVATFSRTQAQALLRVLEDDSTLHDYEIPNLVVPADESWEDSPSKQCWRGEEFVSPSGEWEERIARVWQEHLAPGAPDGEFWLSACADFFDAGGSSLLAGRTIARLRREYNLALKVQDAFEHRTIKAMARLCESRANSKAGDQEVLSRASVGRPRLPSGLSSGVCPLPSALGTISQLVPLLVLYPAKMTFKLMFYMVILARLHGVLEIPHSHSAGVRMVATTARIILAIGLTQVTLQFLNPLVCLASKWLIIGRYTAGEYPMWSAMYYRWWLVEKIRKTFGAGFFDWNSTLKTYYYRLLGAKIGRGAYISAKTMISEFDLVTIGDGAILGSMALIRPFGLSRGKMILQPVSVGVNSEVGMQSVVAPGHAVPDEAYVGPASSSYSVSQAAWPRGRYETAGLEEPGLALKLFLGYPLVIVQCLLMYAPLAFILFHMASALDKTSIRALFIYFSEPDRIGMLLVLTYVRCTIEPIIGLFYAIVVKRFILGPFRPGRQVGQWPQFQRYMMPWLLGRDSDSGDMSEDLLSRVTDLFGTHFWVTAWLYRALGAKVGERVYWPGSGMHITEFDLLEIGNDVVFGSRSVFAFRCGDELKPIKIGSGAMVADRCVLLPGSSIGTNCLLGSGGLCPEDRSLPSNTTWVGSDGGEPVELRMPHREFKSTIKPFGRAVYRGEAPYFVWPIAFHTLFSLIWAPLIHHEAKVVIILTLTLIHRCGGDWVGHNAWHLTQDFFAAVVLVNAVYTGVVLAACLGLQQLLLGVRTPGLYRWDQSSYCQRWLFHRRIRRAVQSRLDAIAGSPMLCSFFRRSGAEIGAGTCLYPSGASPMMTEPELVSIGEGACIDDCSLVAHINTYGELELRKVAVGNMAAARSRTRVLSGGSMEDNTELREHSLVLAGDSIPSWEVWQGWPARSRWPMSAAVV